MKKKFLISEAAVVASVFIILMLVVGDVNTEAVKDGLVKAFYKSGRVETEVSPEWSIEDAVSVFKRC